MNGAPGSSPVPLGRSRVAETMVPSGAEAGAPMGGRVRSRLKPTGDGDTRFPGLLCTHGQRLSVAVLRCLCPTGCGASLGYCVADTERTLDKVKSALWCQGRL